MTTPTLPSRAEIVVIGGGIVGGSVPDHLVQRGRTCFGELAGWEPANWFAPPGVEPRHGDSSGRQTWFPCSGAQHQAIRGGVGILDQTSFGKFLVQGRDAEAILRPLCANDVAVAPGRVVDTQWLNDCGGIEADLTVTRLAPTESPFDPTGSRIRT
jgi:4-methylaminobutanoate oxidase (formaldehyde-forming)